MLAQNYQKILNELRPFVISYSENLKYFRFDIWNYTQQDFTIVDPLHLSSNRLFQMVKSVDEISFGPQGMSMENWVMFDCGAMPSAIVGFGAQASQLPKTILKQMSVTDQYQDLIPISFFIAIPMVQGDSWFGHNLSSLNQQLGNSYPGLGLMTKALGIKLLGIQHMFGATQWGSPSINIHCQLAPMEILSSYTPVHTYAHSLCYRSNYANGKLDDIALSGNKREVAVCDLWLDAKDHKAMQELQQRIELGERFIMNGRPKLEDSKILYPITRI